MDANENTTLSESIDWLQDRIEEGAECPCCGQFAKVYQRKINSGIARMLITMSRQPQQWCHMPTLGASGGDPAKARYWGLIEESDPPGHWRLTQLGRDFVANQARVPKFARIYDGRLLGLEGSETVSIIDALGTRFNYDELMRGI